MGRQEDDQNIDRMPEIVKKVSLTLAPGELGRYEIELQNSSLEIVVIHGDITNLPVQTDAIMCPSEIFFRLGRAKVENRIHDVAGDEPFQEAYAIVLDAMGRRQIGQDGFQNAESFAVSAGNLSQKGVKHIIFSSVDNKWGVTPEQISKAVANTMIAASDAGDKSLAIPLIGTGLMKLSQLQSALGIFQGIQKYKEIFTKQPTQETLQTLYIITYHPDKTLQSLP